MAEYRVEFTADSSKAERSIKNLKEGIKGVTKEFESAEIGGKDFIEAAGNLSGLQKELKDARGAVVNIDKAYRDLNKALESLGGAYDKAGRDAQNYHSKLLGLAQDSLAAEDRLRDKNFRAEVDDFDRRLKLAATAASKMSAQQRAIMEFRAGMGARGAIPAVASPIRGGIEYGPANGSPGSPAYLEAVAKAAKDAEQALANAAQTAGTIAPPAKAFQPLSLAAYEAKLKVLKAEARLIAPDSARWKEVNRQILQAERGIENINKRQRLGPTGGQRLGAAGGAFLYGGGLSGGAGSALGGIAGGLAGGVPGAFAGAALGQLADNIGQALGATASYTAEIDKQRIALRNVTKDVAEYESALAFIDRTSRDLAIPQDVLNKQFTQISASVIGAGGNVDAAKEAFLGIAAGIRGTGGSLTDMQGALLATSQVFSKGKVSAEELRQQIGERLPGAFTLFAKSMGKTPQELDKMLEQGQVTLNDFMGFVRLLSTEYGASASEIAASSQAAGDRLATSMSRMREAVGRELQPLGAQFQEILANAVADNEGNLVALAKAFSQAGQAIGSFIEKYGGLIASLGSTVLLFAGTTLAIKGAATAFASLTAAITTASLAVAQYGGVMATLKLAIAGLGGPITLVIAGLALLAKAVYDTNEIFRNFVDNVGGILASDFKNAVEGMAEDAGSSANSIQTAYEDLAERLKPIGSAIEQFFEDVFGSVSNDGKSSASNVDNAFTTAFNNILSQGAAAFSGLSALIGNWWSSLPAPIRNILGGNTASILVGAGAYAAALPGRTADGPPPSGQLTGMYGRYGAPESQVPFATDGKKTRINFGGGGGAGGSGGGGGKAANDAKRAAEQAAQAEQRIQDQLRSLTREIELNGQLSAIKELQFQAEMDGNKELQARLQGEERTVQILQATAQSLDGITDERLRQKTLASAASEIASSQQETMFDMQRIEAERTKAFNEIIADLDLELALKTATTEQAREQLRLEAELAKLRGQGFTPDQIDAIATKKTELAAPKTDAQSISATIVQLQDEIRSLTSISNIAITSAEGIGSAFATSFKGLIDGSMSAKEALGGFFKSVADMFLEMAAQIIAKQITMIILQTILKALGAVAGGGGGGAMPGAAPQMTPGAIVTPTGFSGQFAGIAGNGATFANGIASFARGGTFSNSIVSSPTMFKFADGGAMRTGLMGEAGPEAIMPLKRGADGSLGVQASGLREAMGRNNGGASGSPILNMSFQSTNINGVEYVSRDQLEAAMAQTRRDASNDGAKRGMSMTLDKLQQSPSTRRKVGI